MHKCVKQLKMAEVNFSQLNLSLEYNVLFILE